MAKKKVNWAKWIFVMAALAVVIWVLNDQWQPSQPPDENKYYMEKTGAGVVVNYTDSCLKLHKTVDKILGQNDIAVLDTKEERKELRRETVEGMIKWHARSILVKMSPELRPEQFKELFAQALRKEQAVIFSVEPDVYQSHKVVRMDVGFTNRLDHDTVTIITDRIYIIPTVDEVPALPPKERQTPGEKAAVRARLAIIVDDFGYSGDTVDQFCNIERPITFSVLPFRPYSRLAAERAQAAGKEVMLHLPMEPLDSSAQSEKETILISMDDNTIKDITRRSLSAVPEANGVNNHQGSRATADKRVMQAVFSVMKKHGLFFIDSKTNSSSIAYETAANYGLRTNHNNIFIDNKANTEYIKNQLRKAKDIALQNGSAIVIGHARPTTAAAIQGIIAEFEAQGIEFVFASQLTR